MKIGTMNVCLILALAASLSATDGAVPFTAAFAQNGTVAEKFGNLQEKR